MKDLKETKAILRATGNSVGSRGHSRGRSVMAITSAGKSPPIESSSSPTPPKQFQFSPDPHGKPVYHQTSYGNALKRSLNARRHAGCWKRFGRSSHTCRYRAPDKGGWTYSYLLIGFFPGSILIKSNGGFPMPIMFGFYSIINKCKGYSPSPSIS